YLSGGDGIVIDCVFDGNVRAGLWCDNYASHELMRDSFINTTEGDGLRCYRYSAVSVDTCTLSQNAGHGALVFTSSPSFNFCTITDNALSGALCKRSAMPKFCWNTISGNTIGISAESSANPHVGDGINDDTGNNSILDNSVAAVANYTNNEQPVSVRYNWWGSYPPTGRIFIGNVRYYPCLQQPPVHGTGGRYAVGFEEDAAPSMFRLGHCSPNPFNPVTSVDYDVPGAGGHVDISVFDVAGRLVTTLYSGYHDQGTHSVTWDGRDDRGRDVASGIYFVRLDTADYRASRKMVLLK
ncbi:MAG TPA: FlgD immunoglobulin-like domain containing protein, partial [bacterium]|nr:FlgD immunoglobulin-like domain containing protein [bacterium]